MYGCAHLEAFIALRRIDGSLTALANPAQNGVVRSEDPDGIALVTKGRLILSFARVLSDEMSSSRLQDSEEAIAVNNFET